MLKWIGQLMGGSSKELPDGVSTTWADLLEKWLEPIDQLPAGKSRPGLARDLFHYVLTGEPLTVLGELGQFDGVAAAIGVTANFANKRTDLRQSFYQELDTAPAAAGLRWARVLEASGAKHSRTWRMQFPGGVHWPEALLLHAAGMELNTWTASEPVADKISTLAMESLLAEAGLNDAAVLLAAFATPVDSAYGAERRLRMVSHMKAYAEAVDRHLEALRPTLLTPAVAQRVHVLWMLRKANPETLERIAPELVELATTSSKQVRAGAEPLIRQGGQAVIDELKRISKDGKPEQRVNALRWLWLVGNDRGDTALQSFAKDSASADKAPTAQALVGEWESATAAAELTVSYDYQLPTIDWNTPLTPEVESQLDNLWQRINAEVDHQNERSRAHHVAMQAKGHNFRLHIVERLAESELKAVSRYVDSGQLKCQPTSQGRQTLWRYAGQLLPQVAAESKMQATLVMKVLAFFGILVDERHAALTYPASQAFNALFKTTGHPTLLELSLMMEEMGLAPLGLIRNYCSRYGASLGRDWPTEAVWPFFAHHVDLLAQCLTQNLVTEYGAERSALFKAVAMLPLPPPAVVNALFELALGAGKGDRPLAQEALANLPGKEERIVKALADGKSETRAVAAQWLMRLRYAPAIPALEAAVSKEKHDVAKGAMLDALQALGQPVERYLDRNTLAAEATKALSKGVPKDIEWLPWAALPEVKWADSGEVVSPDVVKWWLVQAVKQKSPEPNAVLRKYCSMLEPRSRSRLGQFVLETWMREDVKPIAPEEAQKLAASRAQSTHGYMQRYPQHFQNQPILGKSVEELTAYYLPGFLRQPVGSAISSKGLLAIAAACSSEASVPPVARYLKEYYGTRASQGKALIAMLAWIEHPSAIQLMLSIGNRFRTKSFQEEATRQAEALAERKNWTLAELADRTIPTAGFDDTGVMELSYGERRFTASLLPDFKVELHNPEGKKIAALPEPRQDDDAELAKEAKKAFSGAKKQIKSIVDLQTDRLYEALCTERDWSFADWSLYLNQHPIVRRLVQRLVWVEMREGVVAQSFRPLDDGTLTDREDNEVSLAPEARVRIAHDSLLPEDVVAQWQQHLKDYEVSPLFQQLGKGCYTLPAGQRDATKIKDFEGHLLEAFALRGRALKLGYTRGAAEDGGWFYVYEKRFPTLGLQATLEFTGNPLPEENRTVALLGLSFAASGGNRWEQNQLPLSKVPKILLSECYNDLRLIAAEGSGFDPDWQKKSEF